MQICGRRYDGDWSVLVGVVVFPKKGLDPQIEFSLHSVSQQCCVILCLTVVWVSPEGVLDFFHD